MCAETLKQGIHTSRDKYDIIPGFRFIPSFHSLYKRAPGSSDLTIFEVEKLILKIMQFLSFRVEPVPLFSARPLEWVLVVMQMRSKCSPWYLEKT